ncbi:MAG: hypothetical protein LLF97_08405 [Planctomycetaceae bacterium]|nr:hypothetical protein [Planctomycetaceae bacterium]
MIPISAIVDYKNRFGSKWKDEPYRSGFDQRLLSKAFAERGFSLTFTPFSEVFASGTNWKDRLVLYTSSEEIGRNYKPFIEDIVEGLAVAGAHLLPAEPFLRAHDDKVFMEILRDQLLGEELSGIKSRGFGTLEEFQSALDGGQLTFPCVLKGAFGAMSRNVALARNAAEALREVKRLSRTPHYRFEWRDYLRSKRWPGYLRESLYQQRLVVQPFIPGLDGDWKVLVYGDQYYVLKRHIRPGDFRASGSHMDYRAGLESGITPEILSFVEKIYQRLDVPHLSADIAFDGKRSYLIEFQTVYFGTSTQAEFCKEYFIRRGESWTHEPNTMSQEEVFAWGLSHYLKRHPELLGK